MKVARSKKEWTGELHKIKMTADYSYETMQAKRHQNHILKCWEKYNRLSDMYDINWMTFTHVIYPWNVPGTLEKNVRFAAFEWNIYLSSTSGLKC